MSKYTPAQDVKIDFQQHTRRHRKLFLIPSETTVSQLPVSYQLRRHLLFFLIMHRSLDSTTSITDISKKAVRPLSSPLFRATSNDSYLSQHAAEVWTLYQVLRSLTLITAV